MERMEGGKAEKVCQCCVVEGEWRERDRLPTVVLFVCDVCVCWLLLLEVWVLVEKVGKKSAVESF